MTDSLTIRRAYADTPYGQLHYRHAGAGEPLLLIHQTATSSYAYEPVMAHLAPSCRVIAVDTPGYGMSDYPVNREYTAADYARTFAAFLESLDIERASVFGHHTGASFACELAAAFPEKVDKLIVDGTPYWEDPIGDFLSNVAPHRAKGRRRPPDRDLAGAVGQNRALLSSPIRRGNPEDASLGSTLQADSRRALPRGLRRPGPLRHHEPPAADRGAHAGDERGTRRPAAHRRAGGGQAEARPHPHRGRAGLTSRPTRTRRRWPA